MLTSEMIRPDGELLTISDHKVEPFGPLRQILREEGRVILEGENGLILIQWVNAYMVRITGTSILYDYSEMLPTFAAMLSDNTAPLPIEIIESERQVIICSGELNVRVDKEYMGFDIVDLVDLAVCDKHQYYSGEQHLQCRGTMTAGAQIYGLGETTGYLNKRGERYTMWNSDVYSPHVADTESLYQSIPVLVHHHEGNAYGLFLDNPGKVTFDLRVDADTYRMDLETGVLDCYYIAGPSLKEVTMRYTELTGRMEMPPLWAAGYQQSRYSYQSQEEVLELARSFRAKQIPCDVIYLDIHYMDEFKVFTFDPEQFPDPKGMIVELKRMGFRIIPIVDPGVKVDERFKVYREGDQNGYFCSKEEGIPFEGEVWPGISVFPDFSDDEASYWWGDLHKFYAEMGISGIWNDMNEPSVFRCESKTMDLDVVHRNNGSPITHGDWHNMYGLAMSKATYEGLSRSLQGERPFVLTRAGYAGIQRYAAVWTGDNRSYWEHMAMFMPMSMNLGISGVAFCGSDIGGFEHSASGELLVRWTQMGIFSSLCRNHSAHKTLYQEPWRFGPEVEAICREYISLRYRMLPYLYSYFREASLTGLPIMRPLVMEYPDDCHTYYLSDQFLFGTQILVAPIYRPNTEYRTVYLPKGSWYDYWTGERLEGGEHRMVFAPLERIPMYVKAGAILPETSTAQYTSDAGWQALTLNFYSNGTAAGNIPVSEYLLYEDDGLTDSYKQGVYNCLKFVMDEQEATLTIGYHYEHKEYGNNREFLTMIVKNLQVEPRSVGVLQQVQSAEELIVLSSGWYYDSSQTNCVIKAPQQDKWECLIH